MRWKCRLGSVCVAMLLAAPPRNAEATIAQANIAVSATVTTYCSITAAPLPFGSYTGALLHVTGTVTAQCTNGVAYTVGLDPGQNYTSTRTMVYSGNNLAYSLYSDAGYSVAWGNSAGSWVTGSGTGVAQPLTVYGALPAGQNVPTGSYSDTVTATITY